MVCACRSARLTQHQFELPLIRWHLRLFHPHRTRLGKAIAVRLGGMDGDSFQANSTLLAVNGRARRQSLSVDDAIRLRPESCPKQTSSPTYVITGSGTRNLLGFHTTDKKVLVGVLSTSGKRQTNSLLASNCRIRFWGFAPTTYYHLDEVIGPRRSSSSSSSGDFFDASSDISYLGLSQRQATGTHHAVTSLPSAIAFPVGR
ncbi:hypothetical protein VTO42DRAFT_4865 [Malbranchea cinnamomea]